MEVETTSSKELKDSKAQLDALQSKLDAMLDQIERDIDEDKKLSKETFRELKKLSKKYYILSRRIMRKNLEKINLFKVTRLKEKRE